MSNIRLQGNPSGTGTLTIASPNTNSDFTLNLPASNGTLLDSTGSTTLTNLTVTNGASIQGLTVGRGAGAVATNTAVGASALAANTTGTATAIGQSALQANTTGLQVTGIGQAALTSNTTGANNTALGYASALLNTTGSNNTALGSMALFSNTTASNNTAVGYQAGFSNTVGGSNVFVGFQAGYASTGDVNTVVGYYAGAENNIGSYNALFGTAAGQKSTGQFNTFIGNNAGWQVTTGGKNTILGRYNGNQGGLDIRTASNNIVLSDGDGVPREFINSSGTTTLVVDRTSSTNAVALVLSDNVTGAQTNGVYKAIRSQSNAGSSVSEIRFIETDGTNNNTAIAFATAATAGGITEKMRVLNTGAILALAGATLNSSGTGIGFPTSQNASTDPNVLDDYEEGTFTPVLTGSGGSAGSYAASSAEGIYTKIGNLVTATVAISLSNLGSWSGTVRCSLPFTVGLNGQYAKGCAARIQTHTFTGTVVPDSEGTAAYFRFNLTASGSTQTNWQWSSLSSGANNYINVTFIYQV